MSSFARGRARFTRSALTLGACGLIAAVAAVPAGAAVTGTNNADDLGAAITNAPVTGAALNAAIGGGADPFPAAVSDTALAGFPTGGANFAVLTSGDAELADDANDSGSSGANLGYTLPARGAAFDPLTLAIPVTPPAGTNCLVFDYKFLSEEFPEFVNAGFNDGFIAELDSTSWTVASGAISAPGDFAAPAGDKVSVDTVGPTSVSDVNSVGTTYDAGTGVLTTKAQVSPGQHTLLLSVFDSGDGIFDSAAFVDNLRFTNEPPTTCKPPDIFAGQVGVAVTKTTYKSNGKVVNIPMTCLLQVGITVNCDGIIALKAKLPKFGPNKAAARLKNKSIGSTVYAVAPGTTSNVPVKLNKKGRKALKFANKLKGKATITNTSNGASTSFNFVLKKKKK